MIIFFYYTTILLIFIFLFVATSGAGRKDGAGDVGSSNDCLSDDAPLADASCDSDAFEDDILPQCGRPNQLV